MRFEHLTILTFQKKIQKGLFSTCLLFFHFHIFCNSPAIPDFHKLFHNIIIRVPHGTLSVQVLHENYFTVKDSHVAVPEGRSYFANSIMPI